MQKKLSLWLEDAVAAGCLICLMVFAPLTTFSLERKHAPVAPAAPVALEAPLLLPLQCTARVRQSNANESPRARLLYAAELNDARCYKPREP